MSSLFLAAVLLAASAAQFFLAGRIEVFGTTPDLIFCVAVFAATRLERSRAVTFAWTAGLVSDLLVGSRLGPFAFSYAIAAEAVVSLYGRHANSNLFSHMVVPLLSGAAANIICWLATSAIEMRLIPGGLERSARVAAYTALVAPFVFFLLKRTARNRSSRRTTLRIIRPRTLRLAARRTGRKANVNRRAEPPPGARTAA